jgi:hypothetical protein
MSICSTVHLMASLVNSFFGFIKPDMSLQFVLYKKFVNPHSKTVVILESHYSATQSCSLLQKKQLTQSIILSSRLNLPWVHAAVYLITSLVKSCVFSFFYQTRYDFTACTRQGSVNPYRKIILSIQKHNFERMLRLENVTAALQRVGRGLVITYLTFFSSSMSETRCTYQKARQW